MSNEKCPACGSCGMPMEKAADFALGQSGQPYCSYCTDKSGQLQSWEKILEMNVKYYMESQGITQSAATQLATEFLKSQPAWSGARV